MMRRPCSEAGRLFVSSLGLKKGGFLSRYSQIWIGFLLSAAAHHMAALVGCFEDGGYYQALYFLIQPVGIMLEDFVVYLGKEMGWKETDWTRRVGFLWTFLWFSWMLRYIVAYQPFSWIELSVPSFISFVAKIAGKN